MYLIGQTLVATLVCFAIHIFLVAADASAFHGSYEPRYPSPTESLRTRSSTTYPLNETVWLLSLSDTSVASTLNTREYETNFFAYPEPSIMGWKIAAGEASVEYDDTGEQTRKGTWVGALISLPKVLGEASSGKVTEGLSLRYSPPFEGAISQDPYLMGKDEYQHDDQYTPVAIKKAPKGPGRLQGFQIIEALNNRWLEENNFPNPVLVQLRQSAWLEESGEGRDGGPEGVSMYSLSAYELLAKTLQEMMDEGKTIEPKLVLRSWVRVGKQGKQLLNLHNMDPNFEHIMVENADVSPREAKWKVINWDNFVETSDKGYDYPVGTMGYAAPEVIACFANIDVPSEKDGESEEEKQYRQKLQRQKATVQKYLGEKSLQYFEDYLKKLFRIDVEDFLAELRAPAWKAEPAAMFATGMVYFYLLATPFTDEVTDEMRDLEDALFEHKLPRDAPAWYWVRMVLTYLKTGEISSAGALVGLDDPDDFDKEFFDHLFRLPDHRWTYDGAWELMLYKGPDINTKSTQARGS